MSDKNRYWVAIEKGIYIHPDKQITVELLRRVFYLYKRASSKEKQFKRLRNAIWYPKTEDEKSRKQHYHDIWQTNYHRQMFLERVIEGHIRRVEKE